MRGRRRFPAWPVLLVAMIGGGVFLAYNLQASRISWAAIADHLAREHRDLQHLSDDALALWLEARPGAQPVLLDARSSAEYAVSRIPGALHLGPVNHLPADLAERLAGRRLVVYCSVGIRSARVAEALVGRGWDASNLAGGIFTWAAAGRPLVDAQGPTELVHPYNRTWGQLLPRPRHAWQPGRPH